jgi:hypothetical protein
MSVVVVLIARSIIQSLTVLEMRVQQVVGGQRRRCEPSELRVNAVEIELQRERFSLGSLRCSLIATSRPACHALRRRAHGGRIKRLTPTEKCTKRKTINP